ncbi:MAG: YlbF family regulator [Oscillospiraceae bacterium]
MEKDDKIIGMTRALGRAIQMDERCVALRSAREENDANSALQDAIGRFNLAKLNLNGELSKDDSDKDKIMRFNADMQDAYSDIALFEGMQKYAQAKHETDALFNFVTAIIASAINGEDPDAVEEPTEACSGSCESCGGCG